MSVSWRNAAVLLGTLLVGCGSPQDEGVALVAKVGASRLVAEVASLERVSSKAPQELAEHSWPASIRELRPQTVRVAREGVYVRRWKRFVEEEGVFVAFAGAAIDTTAGRDPSFSPIAARVYWYRIKG